MSRSCDTDEDLAYFRHFFEAGGLEVDDTDFDGVRTQLHNAAHNNCLRIAKFLLRRNADACLVAEKGYTPLHIAAKLGHDYMIGMLLKYSNRERVKKFIDAKTTSRGYTALHFAAKNNKYDAVRLLLCYGASFEVKDNSGKMPIQLTTMEKVRRLLGSTGEMSRAAIEAKKYSLDDLNLRLVNLPEYEYIATSLARNRQGYTPLQVALHSNHLPTVKTIGEVRLQRFESDCPLPGSLTLLAEQISLAWNNIMSNLGKLKLENLSEKEALREGSYMLFRTWQIVEAFDEYRKSLKEPHREPHVKFIEEVLEVFEFDKQHFETNGNDDDLESFCTKAQGTRYYRMLNSETERKTFIELAEYVISRPTLMLINFINSSSLLAAVNKDDLKAAAKCTEKNNPIDMDIRDKDEKRPLHIAVTRGNDEMVEFLLINKANMLMATENDNETPLHVAVEKGHLSIVELLLRQCDVVKVNDYVNTKIESTGTTALHLAVKNNRLDIACTLLEYHAIYCLRDKRGKSPSDLSFSVEMTKLFKFIEEIFDDVQNGKVEVLEKLKTLERDMLLAVGNACNRKGYSAPQVASLNKHRAIGIEFFKMVVEAKKSKDAEFVKSRA